MNSYNIKAYKYPLKITMIYFISTVVMYFAGTYVWEIPSPIKLLLFLTVSYMGFWIGGLRGLKKRYVKIRIIINKFSINIITLFRFSCFFSIVAYIVMVNYYGQGFRFIGLLSSAGEVYIEKASRMEYERSYLVQIFSWFWAFTYLYIPIGLVYLKKIKRFDKFLLWTTVAICILYWLSIGTMKGIGDILIQFISCYAFNKFQRSSKEILKRDSIPAEMTANKTFYPPKYNKVKSRKKKYTIFLIIAVVLFLFVFDTILESRDVAIYGTSQSSTYLPSTLRPFVKEIREIPVPTVIESLIFYVSHGYTGLAYSLDLPFEWTGMIGFSRSLTEIFESRLPIQVNSITYMQRVEEAYGWHNGMLWSTIFPWIAGDVTFYGVPFVMMLLGYIFTSTWKRCLRDDKNRKILDIVLFNQWCLMVIFIPCNNQIFQSRQSLFAIILLVLMRIFLNVNTNGLDKMTMLKSVHSI
jgi:hypothetical protein